MDIINLTVKASYQLYVVDPETIEPDFFGNGCIVNYQGRSFLLSVRHVTDKRDRAVCIQTNQPPEEDLQSSLYSVGSLCYFDEYRLPENIHDIEFQNIEELQAKSNKEPDLDIAFCEIKDDVECIQPEFNFGEFRIDRGHKVHLNLDLAGDPCEGRIYGFSGTVRHQVEPAIIRSEPTLKLGLNYQCTVGKYHLFRAPEIIRDDSDYKACSGAPILEDTGKLVGLFTSFNKCSTMIFGFSILECKNLLDRSLELGLL